MYKYVLVRKNEDKQIKRFEELYNKGCYVFENFPKSRIIDFEDVCYTIDNCRNDDNNPLIMVYEVTVEEEFDFDVTVSINTACTPGEFCYDRYNKISQVLKERRLSNDKKCTSCSENESPVPAVKVTVVDPNPIYIQYKKAVNTVAYLDIEGLKIQKSDTLNRVKTDHITGRESLYVIYTKSGYMVFGIHVKNNIYTLLNFAANIIASNISDVDELYSAIQRYLIVEYDESRVKRFISELYIGEEK